MDGDTLSLILIVELGLIALAALLAVPALAWIAAELRHGRQRHEAALVPAPEPREAPVRWPEYRIVDGE